MQYLLRNSKLPRLFYRYSFSKSLYNFHNVPENSFNSSSDVDGKQIDIDPRYIRISFLGTVSQAPSIERNTSSYAITSNLTSQAIVVDAGEGTQIQLIKAGIKSSLIKYIFITHLHGDHIFGLPGLISKIRTTQSEENKKDGVHIIGPPGLRTYLRNTFRLTRSAVCLKGVRVDELHTNNTKNIKLSDEGDENIFPNENIWNCLENELFTVRAAKIKHTIPCWGYSFHEKDKVGHLNVEKLKQLGLPPSPKYKDLKNGISITSPDGTIIKPEDVTSPTIKGRKLVILGDTSNATSMIPISRDCDVLLHECTLLPDKYHLAQSRGHSTAKMAATFARDINAKSLVLTHFGNTFVHNEELLQNVVNSCSKFYNGKVIRADDLMYIDIAPNDDDYNIK
eukprot:TRINITY_DN9490_c0_g1_i1.p1 TRINITY_DN9490_c0_g1~~TRINITY_DN9490_c0_g1_i1.p1  ORF type:complete len:395 (+),score=107.10 TRINITY_DN9490_c0_g1_i1:185-1369(+)